MAESAGDDKALLCFVSAVEAMWHLDKRKCYKNEVKLVLGKTICLQTYPPCSMLILFAIITRSPDTDHSDLAQDSPVRIHERRSDSSDRSDTNKWMHKLQSDRSETFFERTGCMARWRSGRMPDLRSVGRGFESQLPCCWMQPLASC